MAKPDVETWHLDKRVPIALILTLLLQMGAALWWASRMDTRVGTIERHIDGQLIRNSAFSAGINTNQRDLAVVMSEMSNTNTSLRALKEEFSVTNELLREVINDHGRFDGILGDRTRNRARDQDQH